MKSIFKITVILLFILAWGCDKDDFAEINTKPSEITEPRLDFSIAKIIEQMHNDDYTVWFYNNFDYVFPWCQLTTTDRTSGNEETFVDMVNTGGQDIYGSLFPNVRDIRSRIDAMENSEEKGKRKAMRAMTFPILIYTALTVTDNIGSLVYNEAALAPYTNPPLLTPQYDNQEMLFNTWLDELNAAIPDLSSSSNQFKLGDQDWIYRGDYKKWAKFCNLLKLRIAARLINKNRTKALQIAEEVANSPVGYMDALEDDFIYNKGVKYYGTGNGTDPGGAAKGIVDFLKKNKDPRLRFIFSKNEFNAEIVQAFIDQKKKLPAYVEQYINYDGSGNFTSWKAPGEPWIRYFGLPVAPDATVDPVYNDYFNQSENNRLKIEKVEKTYASTSSYIEHLTRTKFDFTYPTIPGGRLIRQQSKDAPSYTLVLGSAAETNLYLAEFKVLGANLPKNAQDYFNKGVELSIRRLDGLAKSNKFPYYESDPVYINPIEADNGSIKLRNGEITALLNQSDYQLNTGDKLEKVYIQQYINFATTANDLWTLVRRSGIPKTGSAYLPRIPFLSSGTDLTVPRRFRISTPLESSLNYQNEIDAAQEQGFTLGANNPSILNTERIWFDKENPNYGDGSKP